MIAASFAKRTPSSGKPAGRLRSTSAATTAIPTPIRPCQVFGACSAPPGNRISRISTKRVLTVCFSIQATTPTSVRNTPGACPSDRRQSPSRPDRRPGAAVQRGHWPNAGAHLEKEHSVKYKLYAVWNWTILIVQRAFKGFFQVYATITMPTAMWLGCILIVAGYTERIIGEERALELATKHPYWFVFGAAIRMIITCGLGYWAWTTSVSEIDAGFDRRKAKYSRLFKVA